MITKEDIRDGQPKSGMWCPIALAIQGQTCKNVIVGPLQIRIGREIYNTPAYVRTWIELFDNPFSRHLATPFELEL